MVQDFLDNNIYKYLIDKNEFTLVKIIDDTYKFCEYISPSIHKSSSTYSIHDFYHSIRVINYMTEFVKPNIHEYSDFHLALIVLVGLLHDIGMIVSDSEIAKILKTITSNSDSEEEERARFNQYIRDHHASRVKAILTSMQDLYCVKDYNFFSDICLICQSHTESFNWIKENINERQTIANYNYNPQQIALLLKLGDGLDIDARRSPSDLFSIYDITDFSAEEWRKHNPISNYNKISYSNNTFQIYFSGRCDNAYIYRNVMNYLTTFEKNCIEISNLLRNYEFPYRFALDTRVIIDLQTVGFEATSLRFSLNYTRVLNLLLGEQIYGDKRAGLRELLQNSIDAVLVMRELLARKGIHYYEPTIWIEMNRNKNSIIVRDNGTGMTKHVLENYFFNFGSSYYLSDEYKELNLNYSAIGHFGIGFLSCFMLSTKVLLETKSIGYEPIVMELEKKSIFITSQKNANFYFDEGHGTRIELLYNEIIPDVFDSENALIEYVHELLLISDYKIEIINSDEQVFILRKFDSPANRHICTNRFDLDYTLSFPLPFWNDPSDVWGTNSLLLLCCYESDFDSSKVFSLIIDINELFRVLYILSLNQSENQIKYNLNKELDDIKCNNPSIRLFLSLMVKDDDDYVALEDRINHFIFKKAYNGKVFHFYSLIDLEGPRNNQDIVLIGTNDDDLNCLMRPDFYKNKLGKKYSEFLGEKSYKVSERIVHALKADNDDIYIPLDRNAYIDPGEVYANGIRLSGEKMQLPLINWHANLSFNYLLVNVKSDDFELNASRNEFTDKSKQKLYREISIELINDIANNSGDIYSDAEKLLLLKLAAEIKRDSEAYLKLGNKNKDLTKD